MELFERFSFLQSGCEKKFPTPSFPKGDTEGKSVGNRELGKDVMAPGMFEWQLIIVQFIFMYTFSLLHLLVHMSLLPSSKATVCSHPQVHSMASPQPPCTLNPPPSTQGLLGIQISTSIQFMLTRQHVSAASYLFNETSSSQTLKKKISCEVPLGESNLFHILFP